MAQQTDIFNVKDKLPDVGRGSFLVYAPKSFPKNSRWLVAEYKEDVKGFYSESSEIFLDDVTHWCKLPDEPKPTTQQTAVEWLFEQYKKDGFLCSQDEEQAKQMEKEQHESTCVEVIERILDKLENGENTNSQDVFNQYYNETYGK